MKMLVFIRNFYSVQFSRSVMSNSSRPHGLQDARLPCPSPTPRAYSNSCHQVGDAIQPSHPLLSPYPAFNLSQHQNVFQLVSSSHQLAKVLEFQLQHQSFQWILERVYKTSKKKKSLSHEIFCGITGNSFKFSRYRWYLYLKSPSDSWTHL